MKAAIVSNFEQPPKYGDIEAPALLAGEVSVRVRAAALSQLVRAQASGRHYSAGKTLPLVPGADGVGQRDDGRRVYFAFSRPPIGAMAEQVAVKAEYCADIPDGLDDITAAALANPGMSSWAALEYRAKFQRGETVLINGAAGVSGRLAIQVARHLGASRIVVTARRAELAAELIALGADEFIDLTVSEEALTARFRDVITSGGADVVLDYLWGLPAQCFFTATGGSGGGEMAPRIRFVNIGSMAGLSLPVAAGGLRSSGLELMGSGLGSVAHRDLVASVGRFLTVAAAQQFQIVTAPMPLVEVGAAWANQGSDRIVLTM